MATRANPLLVTVDEFLKMDFGDRKAELVHGFIRMMTGGTLAHARVQARLLRHLGNALSGSACEPFGPDMGIRIDESTLVYPDASIICGKLLDAQLDYELEVTDPAAVFEVLSPSTKRDDLSKKLVDYQSLASVKHIVFLDGDACRCRTFTRIGATGWQDSGFVQESELTLPAFDISIATNELFARA